MTNYQRLLSDPDARRILLVEMTYFNGTTTAILRRGQEAWTSGRSDVPPDLPFPAGFSSDLNLEVGIDSSPTFGGVASAEYGLLEFPNRSGVYDAWKVGYSVDGYDVRILCVGYLADGTAISYSEAAASPMFVGVGKGRPSVSTSTMEVAVKGDLYRLDKPLATRLFSPACPHFPGTSAGCIDYGDVLDMSATAFTVEMWIKTDDPSRTGQLLISKDTGSAGWYIDLGTAGAGAIRFGVREQTPPTSDTAAGVIKIGQDHHVAVVWNPAGNQRLIYIDRTLFVTTSVTGNPAGNAASLQIGPSFLGAISRCRIWNTARTAQQIGDNMLLPMLGTGVSQETGLRAMLSVNEGKGGASYDLMQSSSISGSVGTGVTWTTSTWCGPSLVGKRWPVVLGRALDLQLTPIDPARNLFASSWPPPVGIPAVRSNHNALTVTTQYTVDYRGIVTLAAAPSGTISADVQGETMFNGAVSLDGTTGYASGTAACPAGSMSLGAMIRTTTTSSVTRRIANWGIFAAGFRSLHLRATGVNRVAFGVENDATTAFTVEYGPLLQDRFHYVLGVLDVPALQLRLYVDGALVATLAVTGTFNTTQTAFAVGRKSDSSTDFFPGVLDEITIWNSALGLVDAQALAIAPAITGALFLAQRWPCDEGNGSTLTNAIAGGAALTLTGTSAWTQSRIAPADLIGVLTTRYAAYGSRSILFDGTTGYALGTVPCPVGSMSLNAWVLASSSLSTHQRIAGWSAAGGAGQRQLEFTPGSPNTLQFVVTNDAGASLAATYLTTSVAAGVYISALGVLDTTAGQARLYFDGTLVATTAISGTFLTTVAAFALGRSSTSSADFFAGSVDEVTVWNSALVLADSVTLRSGPVATFTVGLLDCWHCDEGQGRSLTNAVAGGGALALTGGYQWAVGASPSGGNLTAPLLDNASAAAFIRQTAADCGWMVEDGSTVLDTANVILTGLHSMLRPDPNTRKLLMGQVSGPTGTPDPGCDFDDSDVPAKSEISPADDKLVAPVYRVALSYARNLNPMAAAQLAGIVTTQPDRYQFGQTEWRTAPAQSLDVLANSPSARELPADTSSSPFVTPILVQSDAIAEAARVLPFYGPTIEQDTIDVRTSGLGLTAGSEIRVTILSADGTSRLGMGAPGKSYRVVHSKRVNNRVTVKAWRY